LVENFGVSPNTSCRPVMFLFFHTSMVTPAIQNVKGFWGDFKEIFKKGFPCLESLPMVASLFLFIPLHDYPQLWLVLVYGLPLLLPM